jgi:hypothetical protein
MACVLTDGVGCLVRRGMLGVLALLPTTVSGESFSLTVPATADIFSAGHDAVPVTPNGGGTLPPSVVLPSGTGRQVQFTSVSGTVSFNTDAAPPQDIYRGQYNGPDGGAVYWQDTKPGNPWPNAYTTDGTQPGLLPPSEKDTVTSFYLDTPADRRVMFLTGVFTTASGPDGTAPSRLDFSSTSTSVPGGRSFTTLSPLVDQLFYVGDGLTGEGSGSLQTFIVPDEATHLYLGLIDGSRFIHGPDFYDNNAGSFSAQLVVVPEPTSLMLSLFVRDLRSPAFGCPYPSDFKQANTTEGIIGFLVHESQKAAWLEAIRCRATAVSTHCGDSMVCFICLRRPTSS